METLSKVFEDKYNKNVKDCTNEEIYHGLLSWTKAVSYTHLTLPTIA